MYKQGLAFVCYTELKNGAYSGYAVQPGALQWQHQGRCLALLTANICHSFINVFYHVYTVMPSDHTFFSDVLF